MSRRKKKTLLWVFFCVLIPALMLADRLGGPGLREAIRRQAFYTADQKTYHGRTFCVAEVIDGDTVDLDAADGEAPRTRVRMLGIDTPETKHPTVRVMYYGPEASAFVKGLAEGKTVTVMMDTVGDQRDRYGRLLAYLRLEDGRILNEEIVRQGYGYADLRFGHSHLEQYTRMMDAAMVDKRGLWKEVRREQLPEWLRRERPLLLR